MKSFCKYLGRIFRNFSSFKKFNIEFNFPKFKFELFFINYDLNFYKLYSIKFK